jgi:hypothetical protein
MPADEPKINVQDGGIVYVGQPFKWKNTGPNKVTASGLGACCPDPSYEVPAQANGKEGNKDASIMTGVQPGNYPYTVSDGIKDTNPSLTVNTSMPK